jgi:hypothetical protein
MRFGLDLDGVVRDFFTGVNIKALELNHPGFPLIGTGARYYEWPVYTPDWFVTLWPKIKYDYDFWMSLEPYSDVPRSITPEVYITRQTLPAEQAEAWLKKHNLPLAPVHVIDHGETKIHAVHEAKLDFFVEDSFEDFLEINRWGVKCFLRDRSYNRHGAAGGLRIKSLTDII